MNSQLYDRVTNGSIVLAVLSALFFERAGSYSWLAGALGIASGLVASTAYFINQVKSKSPDTDLSSVPAESLSKIQEVQDLNLAAQRREIQQWQRYVLAARHAEISKTRIDALTAKALHLYHRQYFYMTAKGYSADDRFTNRVVDIVDRLCSSRAYPSLEFVLTQDGNFVIRQAKGAATRSERATAAFDEKSAIERLVSEKIQ